MIYFLIAEISLQFYTDDVDKKKTLKETVDEMVPLYLSRFDETIKSNGGYLVGGAVSSFIPLFFWVFVIPPDVVHVRNYLLYTLQE